MLSENECLPDCFSGVACMANEAIGSDLVATGLHAIRIDTGKRVSSDPMQDNTQQDSPCHRLYQGLRAR